MDLNRRDGALENKITRVDNDIEKAKDDVVAVSSSELNKVNS